MVPLAAAFAQHATVSSTLIDALAEAALRSLVSSETFVVTGVCNVGARRCAEA